MNKLMRMEIHIDRAMWSFNNSDLQEYDIPLEDFMNNAIMFFNRSSIDINKILHLYSPILYDRLLYPRDFVFYNERCFPFENIKYHLPGDGYAYMIKKNHKKFVLHNDTDPAYHTNDTTRFYIFGKQFSPTQWKEYHNLSTEEITMLRIKYPNWVY